MNILVTGVGGPTPRSFVRAVRRSGRGSLQGIRFIGIDCNPLAYGLYDKNLFDATYIVSRCEDPEYWKDINSIVEAENISVAIVLPEQEVLAWSQSTDQLSRPVITHLPDPTLVAVLTDKHQLHVALGESCLIPRFLKVNPKSYDYAEIIEQIGEGFWIRGTVGSSGFGSLQIKSASMLESWITINPAIEEYIATEYLPGRNLACKLLYFDGHVKRTACAERVQYIMAKVAPSGITGNTSFGRLLNHPELVTISEEAMNRITRQAGVFANGIFTLDFKEDRMGMPKLTEINVRHVAFISSIAEGGANLPADTLDGMLSGNPSRLERIDYQFPQPLIFLRDVDGEPIVIPESDLLTIAPLENISEGLQKQPKIALEAAEKMILGFINSILTNSQRPKVEYLKAEDRLQADLGLDSLELAELTVLIESEFGVDVFDQGIIRTVGEIVERLKSD